MQRTMRSTCFHAFPILLATLVIGSSSSAEEIGYLESFALADDRSAVLDQLIPGSEDYYFYHCLHYQNTEQFDKVDQMLQTWIKRYRRTPRVRQIQTRQALLTYALRPDVSIEYLRNELQLRFDHQGERLDEAPDLPTKLDQELIQRDRLLREALRRHRNLDGFEDSALDWLVSQPLDANRRRHLLQRLRRPDQEGLVSLVFADLEQPNSPPFGSLPIHRELLQSQLEELLRAKPDLRNQTNFVHVYLSKLHPSPDVDWKTDDQAYRAFLDRLWSFVSTLSPAHNSLKTHVLFHMLVLDRREGVYDKERFLDYLRLPRRVAYLEPVFLRELPRGSEVADLNSDFRAHTSLPPVANDEPLVRSYLQHFFLTETTIEPYAPYVEDQYLRHLLAETKLVHGLGEGEQWFSWLPPSQYQQLKERVDLDFAYTNPRTFATDQTIRLELDVKNVRNLIVKVFEINTANYYRETGKEVNTDIHLDGLVPNHEYTYSYDDPSIRRVRRRYEFEELKRRGVYVIDFIGNGISSRAVIRRGQLHHHVRETVAGHVFTVFDAEKKLVPKATLWLEGHEYAADEDGQIVVPYSTKPQRQAVVLQDGDFASLTHFPHAAESYRLVAGFYVDREALLVRREAELIVRPALQINGMPANAETLENVRLEIVSKTHDGIESTQTVEDFKLHKNQDSVSTFVVPPRLQQLSVTLHAQVKQLSTNELVDLTARDQFTLNQIDQTEHVEDVHLARRSDGFELHVLGKSGEPRTARPVHIELKPHDFRDSVTITLQSDEAGRIALGPLATIDRLTVRTAKQRIRSWSLRNDLVNHWNTVHGIADQTVQLPYVGSADQPLRSEFSLLERSGNQFVRDRFDALHLENGFLKLNNLPAGDYNLLLKRDQRQIQIRLTAGRRQEGYLFGDHRHLEERHPNPLQISTIREAGDQLEIGLAHASAVSRVHVFATRFEPAYSVFDRLGQVRDAEPMLRFAPTALSRYAAGRKIGDEYQYIIDRKYADKYPGVMLDRPEVLLNPWALQSTEMETQQAQEGNEFAPAAEPSAQASKRSRGAADAEKASETSPALDFLPDAAIALLNLVPDEHGRIQIPRDAFGANQQIHVVAIDSDSTVYRQHVYDSVSNAHLDRRLQTAFDPARHFSQQKQVSVVRNGETFELDDAATSRFEVYDSLDRVFLLYKTLQPDVNLEEFHFLLKWPDLSNEQKRQHYSRYASHELNFFLARKDLPFFDEVIRPYLRNKKDKTFLDRWLLEESLDGYLLPWHYRRLNAMEQVLLSQRVTRDRSFTTQNLQDRLALLPPDTDRRNKLFQTALAVGDLDADVKMILGARFDMDMLSFSDDQYGGRGSAVGGGAFGFGGMRGADRLHERQLQLGRAKTELESLSMRRRNAAPALAKNPIAGVEVLQERLERLESEVELRESARLLYRELESTMEWAENNYYHLPVAEQNSNLITVNDFWSDFATHEGDRSFLSPHFSQATGNLAEMLCALAVLDLPWEAAEHQTEIDGTRFQLTAGSDAIIFHEEILPAETTERANSILVSQNYFQYGERYRMENNERVDHFITDEFLVHQVYGSQIVITNPSSSRQKLDVLLQIPLGSLPVLNSQPTKSVHLELEPYNTTTLDFHFYFPVPGEFAVYPVQVARGDQLLAAAEPFQFTVVEKLSQFDRQSWAYLSQYGTTDEVLQYLRNENLHAVELSRIAFRMKDAAVFQQVIGILSARHLYDHTLWSYSIAHRDVPGMQQFLAHEERVVDEVGIALESPILTVDPVERNLYQHLEYHPLVNARSHQLGRKRQILNDRFHDQYYQWLTLQSYRRQLDDEARLTATYYLLLQDRVTEALGMFERIDAGRLATRLQYDYFAAYLAFYRGEPQEARQVVQAHLNHPVDRWRNAFVAIDQQIKEIESGDVEVIDPDSRLQSQTRMAATEPSFDFKVESRQIDIRYQNLSSVQVHYYLMDIELLFSRNPFVQAFSGQFSSIRPNFTERIELSTDQSSYRHPLPEALNSANVLVEIRAGGTTQSQAYYANSLTVQVNENYGQVQVLDGRPEGSARPLARTYVKVYAERADGSVRFYKDGYTDLRGRFDYASLSTSDLDQVRRFALLIMSEEQGSVVREAAPPAQ